jgi:hypothetical protein
MAMPKSQKPKAKRETKDKREKSPVLRFGFGFGFGFGVGRPVFMSHGLDTPPVVLPATGFAPKRPRCTELAFGSAGRRTEEPGNQLATPEATEDRPVPLGPWKLKTPRNQLPTPARPSDLETGQQKQ